MEAGASEEEIHHKNDHNMNNNSNNNNGNKLNSSNEGQSKPKRQMKTPFQLETLEKAYACMYNFVLCFVSLNFWI